MLNKILGSVKKDGFSIVPINMYFNEKGLVKLNIGIGKGKSKQVPDAIKKATELAKRTMFQIPLKDGRTLHHDIHSKSGSGKILRLFAR